MGEIKVKDEETTKKEEKCKQIKGNYLKLCSANYSLKCKTSRNNINNNSSYKR